MPELCMISVIVHMQLNLGTIDMVPVDRVREKKKLFLEHFPIIFRS